MSNNTKIHAILFFALAYFGLCAGRLPTGDRRDGIPWRGKNDPRELHSQGTGEPHLFGLTWDHNRRQVASWFRPRSEVPRELVGPTLFLLKPGFDSRAQPRCLDGKHASFLAWASFLYLALRAGARGRMSWRVVG